MTFGVMIATRNRPRDLEATCTVISKLRPAPDEVMICADGCELRTKAEWTRNISGLKLLRNRLQQGSIYSRDRMLRLATSEIVVSLDDDSHPIREDFLERLARCFEAHPEAAVVSFPESTAIGAFPRSETQSGRGYYAASYANCGAAMRREVYVSVPGFANFFEHMYEEADFSLQCHAIGYGVWVEPSLKVVHYHSRLNRDPIRDHQLNARNELWSVWLRCPWPWLPLVSLYRLARQFMRAMSEGLAWTVREPCWWKSAAQGGHRCLSERSAVRWSTYYRWIRLARNPIFEQQRFKAMFPSGTGHWRTLSEPSAPLCVQNAADNRKSPR